jgi:hypothetical protein
MAGRQRMKRAAVVIAVLAAGLTLLPATAQHTVYLPLVLANYSASHDPWQPQTLLELTGTGEVVTDNYTWPACEKTVFYWSAEVGQYGSASLIIKLYQIGREWPYYIVNELEFDAPHAIAGQSLESLEGGEYYLASSNTDARWSLVVQCHDGQPAQEGGMAIEGEGFLVSNNYALPQCSKSVFVWRIIPDDRGTASLIARLYRVGGTWPVLLVNEVAFNADEPVTGEALAPLSGGVYYLGTANPNGIWSLRWECRD